MQRLRVRAEALGGGPAARQLTGLASSGRTRRHWTAAILTREFRRRGTGALRIGRRMVMRMRHSSLGPCHGPEYACVRGNEEIVCAARSYITHAV